MNKLRSMARKAIQFYTEQIRFSVENGASRNSVQMKERNLNYIIDYINELDRLNQEKAAFIRKLLKVCVAFDIELTYFFQHDKRDVDSLLFLKKRCNESFIENQRNEWYKASCHAELFHKKPFRLADKIQWPLKDSSEDHKAIWDKIQEQEKEHESFINIERNACKEFTKEIIVGIISETKGEALKYIDDNIFEDQEEL